MELGKLILAVVVTGEAAGDSAIVAVIVVLGECRLRFSSRLGTKKSSRNFWEAEKRREGRCHQCVSTIVCQIFQNFKCKMQ